VGAISSTPQLPHLMPLSGYGRAQTSGSEVTDRKGGGSLSEGKYSKSMHHLPSVDGLLSKRARSKVKKVQIKQKVTADHQMKKMMQQPSKDSYNI
jgi:hypothetical protein